MIAYIESPLQLLCIMEYIKDNKITKFYIRKSLYLNDKQIFNLIKFYNLKYPIVYLENLYEYKSWFSWFKFIFLNFYKKILFGASNSKIK